MANAMADYRLHVVGVIPQPCPACSALGDQPTCGVCGFEYGRADEPPALPVPPAVDTAHPGDYHLCVLDTETCENCAAPKQAIDGAWVCPTCGEETEKRVPDRTVTQRQPPRQEREFVAPACKNPACIEQSAGIVCIGGTFECLACGGDCGPPLEIVHAIAAEAKADVAVDEPEAPTPKAPPEKQTKRKRGRR